MKARSALALVAALSAGCAGAAVPAHTPPAPLPDPVAPARAEPAPKPEPDSAAPDHEAKAKTAPEREAKEAAPEIDKRPRIASIGPHTWIYKKPEAKGLALGRVRMGESVPLKSDKPVPGEGCGRGWYAVEPRGYVCLRSGNTTLDLEDPYYQALHENIPARDAAWYYRYAYSNGAPMYSRIPTRAEEEKEDEKYGPRGKWEKLGQWASGHEELLLTTPVPATDPVPAIFAGGKRHVGGGTRDPRRLVWRTIPNGSILAYTKSFIMNGRTWLLTPDLMLVPADRVRDIKRSSFHGVDLKDGEVKLPLAWNRTKGPKPRYHREGGKMVAVRDALAAKTFVPISEEAVSEGGKRYYPIRGEAEMFVDEEDVTFSRAKSGLPKGVSPGEKWIEVKILPGTLTAYEGEAPVYATLFSPGKGGVPVPGHDHTKYATTAIGFFPIEWKDHIDTMSSEPREPTVMWFTDVPHIQYLKAPLAMHVAMWHEDFGNPKSAECVNVSPEDGRFLFKWTTPTLPEGWGGMRPGDGNGKSTPVVVTAR